MTMADEQPAHSRPGLRFSDALGCRGWLRGLPLTNVTLSHTEIFTQLTLLQRNGHGIPPLERLKILEMLREPVAFLQGEMAKRYQAKPVPFGHADQAAWDDVQDLWLGMENGYRHCLGLADNPELAEHRALIFQRCLRYVSQRMMEHYRSYRQLPAELWGQLHALYAAAEAAGLESQPLKDRLNAYLNAATCSATYAQALLTHLANPYQLTPKQLALVTELLDKWGARCALLPQPPDNSLPVRIGIDLHGNTPPVYLAPNATAPRYLDTHRLGASLLKRIQWLQKGNKPQEVGLSEDCAQPACEVLLSSLFQLWCKGRPRRAMQRRKGVPKAEVCYGFATIFFHLAGHPFAAPKEGHFYGVRELEDLRLFGQASSRAPEAAEVKEGEFPVEVWDIRDESAQGFGLERLPGKGAPILHCQLLAIKPFDSGHFVLGHIRWLTFDAENSLQMGITLLPGIPVPVSVSFGDRPGQSAPRAEPAFLLPGVAALKEPPSLVMPTGLYRADGLLTLASPDGSQTLRMVHLLEKGGDFDRVSFAVETAPPKS